MLLRVLSALTPFPTFPSVSTLTFYRGPIFPSARDASAHARI